ncbi:MAG TPA: TIM-barrel domain-containing protein [Microlunatus sp.]|nr:TIM-barrel domain-containing protein [Microlunatus sp.]
MSASAEEGPGETQPPAEAVAAPENRTARPRWRRRAFLGTAVLAGTAAAGLTWRSWEDRPQAGSTPSPQSSGGSQRTLGGKTTRGWVGVAFVAEGVARIRITDSEDQQIARSYAIDHDLSAMPAEISSTDRELSLRTDQLIVSIDKKSGAISARTGQDIPIVTEVGRGYAAVADGYRWQILLAEDETCHGLGQRAFPLSLRGRTLQVWNYDAGSYVPGADPLYLNVPFYLGHRPGLSYGIFWDCPARSRIELGSVQKDTLTFSAEHGPACLYLVSADTPQGVVERYSQLTGLMELPPIWALGYHQSRWSYRDASRFRQVAAELRTQGMPCDALHFDIDYMSSFRVFTWNRTRFPDLPALIADLTDQGFNTVAILNPGVMVDDRYSVFQAGTSRDVFLRDTSGRPIQGVTWAGTSQFPDFTDPAVRRWWSERVAEFVGSGFTGLWNDMNEPSIFDSPTKTLPDSVHHDWDGEGNTHVGGGHAVYGMQMARATREGLVTAHPERRPFVMTRAGYAGVQRYATTWNGDSRSSWEHLRMTVPQLCNLGISGIPFSGSDAGGFRGEPGAELYLRWMQLASMTPFFRTHSSRTSKERDPWSYGEPTTGRIRRVIERRYRLLPYLYTQLHRAATAGTPVVRPMFFEEPDDPAYQHIDDQFMLGDSLLIAPILKEGARARTVLLPRGGWYRFQTGAREPGGRTMTVEAGWDLPIFVREGAVVPLWPVRQSTSEPANRITLEVYAGSGTTYLYEDAGDGYEYKRGEFLLSTFSALTDGLGLDLSWRTEGVYVRPESDVEVRVHGLRNVPKDARCDDVPLSIRIEQDAVVLDTRQFRRLTVV